MPAKFTNNAFGTLASSISNSASTITLTSGNGARFPSLGAGEFFYATLVDSSNNLEIVKVTARSTDSLTVTRAQDGTSARAYSAGDRIELRPVAAVLTNMVQLDGNQTIAGTKTFSSTIVGSIDGNAATVTDGVYATTNQTISGTKTFTAFPIGASASTTGGYGYAVRNTSTASNTTKAIAYAWQGTDTVGTVKDVGIIYAQPGSVNWVDSSMSFWVRSGDTITQRATLDNLGTFTATSFSGSGASLTSLNASNLSTGTVGTARLGTGTANSTTFLRGDGTWAAPAGGVTSLNGQTGAITNTSIDAIGSYCAALIGAWPGDGVTVRTSVGGTVAGSSLRYNFTPSGGSGDISNFSSSIDQVYSGGGTALSGTWRCVSRDYRRTLVNPCTGQWNGSYYCGLWVRVS